MKILFLAGDFYPKTSGGAFVDWNAAAALAEEGHQVVVVTPRNADSPKYEEEGGVEIHRPYTANPASDHPNTINSQILRIKFLTLVVPYLLRLSQERSFDVIYSTNHVFHPAAKIFGSIFSLSVVNFVGYSPTIKEDVGQFERIFLLEQLIFRFCMGAKVLCRTPEVRDEIKKHSSAEVEIVHGILDPSEIRSAIQDSEESIRFNESSTTVLFVGRLVDIKRPVKAVEILHQLPSNYELLIIGDGPASSAVEAAVSQYEESDRVKQLGACSHKKTLQYIEVADLLLLTSKTESYGAVVFEALSLKTPVIATPVGILPEIPHNRLTISKVDDIPTLIQLNNYESERGIDEESLKQFSTKKYVDKVIESLEEAYF